MQTKCMNDGHSGDFYRSGAPQFTILGIFGIYKYAKQELV